MKRTAPLFLVALLVACGGGDAADDAGAAPEAAPAEQPAAAPATAAAPALGAMTMPDWFVVDEAAPTVHITLTAGATSAKNYWNYNGYADGNAAITVPEGYTVTIDLINEDPNMAHSVGVSDFALHSQAAPPATASFEGAMTPNPTSMVDGTMPGESVTITFTADAAGQYALMCYVPGHAATGMWLYFNVSSDGTSGVQVAG